MSVSPPSDWDGADTEESDYAMQQDQDWSTSDEFGAADGPPETAVPSPTDLVAAGVVAHGVVYIIRRAWDRLRGRPVTVQDAELAAPIVAPGDSPTTEAEPTPNEEVLARERAMLIDGLVDLDQTWGDRFESLREKIRRTLAQVGVDAIIPAAGEPFDAAEHESVGAESTTAEHLHETIVSADAAGYVDRGIVVRQPQVVVYRLDRP